MPGVRWRFAGCLLGARSYALAFASGQFDRSSDTAMVEMERVSCRRVVYSVLSLASDDSAVQPISALPMGRGRSLVQVTRSVVEAKQIQWYGGQMANWRSS